MEALKKEEGMGKLSLALTIGFSLLLAAEAAFAASDQKNLTVNASIESLATLALGQSAIHFTNADPDTTPSIAATENAVTVSSKVRLTTGNTATLTHVAGGDLTSGSDTIAISNVTWTASGTGYVAGTMNKTTGQSAGSWTTNGNHTGTFSYFLANSWSYAVGTYTATTTYTLAAL
jgi:hypothetical protein